MQKLKNDHKKRKQKTQKYNNPFDDLFFMLSLASTEFSLCSFDNHKELELKPIKILEETESRVA